MIDNSTEEDFDFLVWFSSSGRLKILLKSVSSLAVLFEDPGSGITSIFGGLVKGSFFFTRNSSVVLVYSFHSTFPASFTPWQDTTKIKVVKISNFNY